jgi:two-component system cell cycle sensor histidine kinase/response regulator CckA
MEAIGTLTGGIAHDFNNLLTVIIGNAELALLKPEDNNLLHENIKEIMKAGNCASSLIRQLLTFSRKQITQPEILNINSFIKKFEKMICCLIGKHIEIKIISKNESCKVKMDPGQIEQVFMNLAVNAKDAMPDGGKLSFETMKVELDMHYFQSHGLKSAPGPYVMIVVRDTGKGMDKTIQSRIFEPFFTTKGIHKGTGLGLSTVYGIIKQNNGYIWVASEPGRGTTFTIYLPRVESKII